jgi:hypothetical protein
MIFLVKIIKRLSNPETGLRGLEGNWSLRQWRTEGGLGGSNPPPKFRNFDKVPKIKKILLYEMKFLVPNYSCLQNP